MRERMREVDVPATLAGLECPEFANTPWATPAAKRRVALISTAGLMHRGDPHFGFNSADYRIIDRNRPEDVIMSHISTNFDRTGFARDLNVVFPLDRLDELATRGQIDSVARYHYSFMGATAPDAMEATARTLAKTLIRDEVNTVLLAPV
jgi:D-proline reductase (dithiol) PrdB